MSNQNLTLQELISQYEELTRAINQQWPLADEKARVFARVLKLNEELGELSDEILTSMNLQRQAKLDQFDTQNLTDEYADVLACVLSLGIELKVDIEAAITRKIEYTQKRLEHEVRTLG